MFIIWGAFVAALAVYTGLLVTVFGEDPAVPPERPFGVSPVALVAILCVAQLTAAPLIMRVIRKRHDELLAGLASGGQGGGAGAQELPYSYLALFQVRMIIQAAFYESIGIYGLVGRIAFGLTIPQALAFMGVAAILLVTMLPGMIAGVEKFNKMNRTAGEAPAGHLGGGE